MVKIWIIIIFCFNISDIFSQTYLTKEQAIEDVDEYFETIAKYHPDTYWHSSKEQVDTYIMKIKKKCRDSITVGELMLYLAHSHNLFDVHTSMDFRPYLRIHTDYIFPEVEYKNNKVYLKESGLKINSINSVPIDTILEWQMDLFGSDCHRTYIEFMFSVSGEFQRSINDWNIYPPYKVSVKTSIGKDSVIILAGENRLLADIRVKNSFLYSDYKYKFELYPEEKVAIVRYNDVFWREDYPEIDSLLNSFFLNCKKNDIQYLFFDVSRNTGGYDREFCMFFPYLRMKKGERYKREICAYKKGTLGLYWENADFHDKGSKSEKKVVFNGKIYIYQSIFSTSAIPDFCAIMKVLANATLVGTETGSGIPLYAGSKSFNLKNSKLGYMVATKLYKSELPRLPRTPEGYLLPDVEYPFLTERLLNVVDCKKIIKIKD